MTEQRHFDLAGRRALVTGASRGIGRAIALGLAGAGADLVVTARAADALASLRDEVAAMGRQCHVIEADLFVEDAPLRVVEQAFAQCGGYDLMINNAGWDVERRALDYDWAEWTKISRFNLETPVRFALESARRFMEAGGGKIISIASIAGLVGVRNDSAYVSAKHGVIGFTKAASLEWAKKGVTINAIAPGLIRTDMTKDLWTQEKGMQWALDRTPLGRIGEADDIVAATIFLAGPGADWMTGQVITVDGGWTVQ